MALSQEEMQIIAEATAAIMLEAQQQAPQAPLTADQQKMVAESIAHKSNLIGMPVRVSVAGIDAYESAQIAQNALLGMSAAMGSRRAMSALERNLGINKWDMKMAFQDLNSR